MTADHQRLARRRFRAQLLTGQDAAVAIGKEPSTLRDWVRRGLLVNHGTARAALYHVDELVAAMDAPKPRRHADRHAESLTSLTVGTTLPASQPDVSKETA